MRLTCFYKAVICLIMALTISVYGVDVSAQSRGEETKASRNESGYTMTPYRTYAEFALNMILDRMEDRGLDVSVDPDEYVIGPGDQFGIYFISGDIDDLVCQVSMDGRLFIKSVGPVEVSGVTLRDAIQRINETVQKSYSGTSFDVQLIDFRFVQVNVIGKVMRPGIYYAPAIWRVSEVIELAGGLTPEATQRKITLRSDGEEYAVDLVRFRTTGENGANPFICKGNTVHIPGRERADRCLSLTGLVKQPGIFEIIEGDRLVDFIEYANGTEGNLTDMMVRISSRDGRDETELDGADPAVSDLIPTPGDNITLVWKEGRRAFGSVTILGAVARPGIYPIGKEPFSLKDLLDACGGIMAEGCPEMLQIYRPIRYDFDNRRFDDSEFALSSSGYDYKAGNGFDSRRHQLISYNPRRPLDHSELVLADGDSIYVPRATGMVEVAGAVASPGLIRFRKGEGVEYYLRQAGGLGYDADQQRIVVLNPITGGGINADRAGELFDGETLFVPRKESGTKP